VILNSKDAEMSIIGTLLYDPTLISRVYGTVKPEDFYDSQARQLYRAIIHLSQDGLDVNLVTVLNYLKVRNDDSLTDTELREVMDYRVAPAEVLSFATQVSEFSGYRILQNELEQLLSSVKTRELNSLGEYIEKLTLLSGRVNDKGVKQSFKYGKALIDGYLEMLGRDKSKNKLTGIREIDSHIYDFDAKELTYIAARPGVGKSAIMLQSARINADEGRTVGFISMEMDHTKILNRLISATARVDGTELLKMNPEQFSQNAKLVTTLQGFLNKPFIIDDTGPFNNITIPQKVRKLVYEHGCDIVYLDYVGLTSATGNLSSTNRNEQLSQISRELKNLASELNIPIVAASQLNREVTKRTNGRPTLSDLRESGSLEQDASLVLFIYVDMDKFLLTGLDGGDVDEYLKNESNIHVKIEVAKQRNGPVLIEPVVMEKQFGIFTHARDFNSTY
jgi:replicative DNA helicase